MSASNHPQSALTQPAVIRALIDSRALPARDECALALVNKAIFRSVFREKKRQRIKTIPFSDSRSPFRCYIKHDYSEGVEDALKLGEFDNDTTSPNGRLLHSDEGLGIHLLMGLCIENQAIRCFGFLTRWANKPGSRFTYDHMWVYEAAKAAALRDGKLHCLMYLHDHDKGGLFGSPVPLYTVLLKRIRGPAALAWLSRRMPPGTDYLPILISHCGKRFTQPTLVEVLADLVSRGRLSQPVPYTRVWGGREHRIIEITALSTAAFILHTPIINVLLRCGARAFIPHNDPSSTSNTPPPNPLFTALTHPLPGRPSSQPPNPTKDPKTVWQTFTARHASALHLTVFHLHNQATTELPQAPRHKMLERAALLHLHTLRASLLSNLPWLLLTPHTTNTNTATSSTTQQTIADRRWLSEVLFTPASISRSTAWTAFLSSPRGGSEFAGINPAIHEYYHGAGGGGFSEMQQVDVTWRGGLSGEWVRQKLAEEDIDIRLARGLEAVWELLVRELELRQVVEVAGRFLTIREGGYPGMDAVGVLWELLVAEERLAPSPSESDSDSEASEDKEGVVGPDFAGKAGSPGVVEHSDPEEEAGSGEPKSSNQPELPDMQETPPGYDADSESESSSTSYWTDVEVVDESEVDGEISEWRDSDWYWSSSDSSSTD